MISNRLDKTNEIVATIKTKICEINERYRTGPALYFYKRLIRQRNNSKNVESFLANDYNIEILYATLVSWDMNARGAKMKYFDGFRANILSCLPHFRELEQFERSGNISSPGLISTLRRAYESLALMKTKRRLVSNAKLLHFLFPRLLMPMDGTNTLRYFYGNDNESIHKYVDIIELSLEIMARPEKWDAYFDSDWNTTLPKIIDNAIILLMGRSVGTGRGSPAC